jgi:signal transduction histidine kinase
MRISRFKLVELRVLTLVLVVMFGAPVQGISSTPSKANTNFESDFKATENVLGQTTNKANGKWEANLAATRNEGASPDQSTADANSERIWILLAAGVLFVTSWAVVRWHSRLSQRAQQSTRRIALATEVAHLGMWQWDIVNDRLTMTSACGDLFQFPSEIQLDHKAMMERVHPDDRPRVENLMHQALIDGTYQVTHRLQLPDQRSRWITVRGSVEYDRAQKPVRMLCVCMDISEQHNAEEAARELSGRLIHAQEDERRRIARELHDDLNQRLALLSVEMELFGRSKDGPDEERNKRVDHLVTQITELSTEVHTLSYRLHPAKLDQLGLVAAARSFCRELMQQSGIKIDFIPEKVPREIPEEIALSLYRLIQESLQNIVRHSRATKARVQLRFAEDHLHLEITDWGIGINLADAKRKGGLGLISMEERVRLVMGSFKVQSLPGLGTQISASIPFTVKREPLAFGPAAN